MYNQQAQPRAVNNLGQNVDLSQPAEHDHGDGGQEQVHAEQAVDRAGRLQDEVELDNLQRHGDQQSV